MPRLLLVVVLLAVAACSSGTPDGGTGGAGGPTAEPTASGGPAPGPTASSSPAGSAQAEDQAYVGLTEQEAVARAEAAGVPVRVVVRDGESFPQTMDLREDRINLTVEDDRVVGVRRG